MPRITRKKILEKVAQLWPKADATEITGMLDGWHHMNPGLYQRVQALGEDFESDGPVATAVRQNYRLSRREAQGIITRGIEVAQRLRERCEAGDLRFDLALVQILSLRGGNAVSDQASSSEQPGRC